ncbi:MAG TPA: hypothetical protein ENI85_11200 [Deltaproteobacteria bacterium]|nr:hypothetical protein [Deltaproteobacteria bacterium]
MNHFTKQASRRLALVGLGVLIQAAASSTARADGLETLPHACALLLSEARFELEDRREEERLAPIRSAADQAIYELLEPLWKARSTEWLRYLAARHARDRSRLEVDRAGIETKRAEEKLTALTRECVDPGAGTEKPTLRYERLGCDLARKTRDIAALDLAYRKEVLESTNELRRLELATAQDLIHARYALDRAKAQLQSRSARWDRCKRASGRHP